MCTLSRALAQGVLLLGGLCWAQQPALKIDFEHDSPVTVVQADWGESRTEARGGAMVLDLHTSLMLRNSGTRTIRGITLLVSTQEFAPGGKGSVAVPSLDAKPGDTFPIRIDLRLLRPLLSGRAPLATVSVDGILFADLSFYGPNTLNSRRALTAWELEARRDRRYLREILETRGRDALRREMVDTLARLSASGTLDVQLVRGGRATAVASAAEREVEFAFLRLPDAPVEPISGVARVAGSEARAPKIRVLNRSKRPVRYFEIGWIIRDQSGHEYMAGSVPASNAGLALAPGAQREVAQETAMRFSRDSRPIAIGAMTGFVSQVEFSDGSIWVPSRAAISSANLGSVIAPSPEEQRLAGLYRRKGLEALIEELKRLQ
ncbi:MAG: hypothetical protein ACM3ZB_03565 [bacterium]|jgi:hypothetical protein